MMNFHCPDFYHHFFLCKELLFLYYNHNECFKDNAVITMVPYLIKQEYQQDLFNLLLSTPII